MDDLPIGYAIKNVRESRKLTQLQVAERMGCDRAHVSRHELDRARPSLESFVRLCDAMGAEPWRVLRFMCRLRDQLEGVPQQKKEDSPVCPGNVSAAVAEKLSKVQLDSVVKTIAEKTTTNASAMTANEPLPQQRSCSAPCQGVSAPTVMAVASASADARQQRKKNKEAA